LKQLKDSERETLDPSYKQEVGGSSPSLPTKRINNLVDARFFMYG
jgi:hypothetical protein